MTTPTLPRTAPDDPPVIRLSEPGELVAVVPYRLRFHPERSVVLIGLVGARRGVGPLARLDLADVLGPDGPVVLARAAAHLAAGGTDEVVVVLYAPGGDPRDPGRDLRPRPGTPVVRAARRALASCASLGPVAAWVVTGGRYLELDCRDPGCCPPGGRPLGDVHLDDAVSRAVGGGREPLASRDLVGAVPAACAGPRRSAAAARSRWADLRGRAAEPAEVLAWRRESLATWRTALAAVGRDPGADVPPPALGRLEAGLADRAVRDAVLLTLLGADGDLAAAVLEDEDAGRDARQDPAAGPVPEPPAGPAADPDAGGGDPVRDGVRAALDGLLVPDAARAPDDRVVAAGTGVLERVVAHGRRERQAPALTLLAVLAWWSGDGVRAAVLTERALRHDPSYRLAELLVRALAAGLPPAWLRPPC
jgi:hypothetical protein